MLHWSKIPRKLMRYRLMRHNSYACPSFFLRPTPHFGRASLQQHRTETKRLSDTAPKQPCLPLRTSVGMIRPLCNFRCKVCSHAAIKTRGNVARSVAKTNVGFCGFWPRPMRERGRNIVCICTLTLDKPWPSRCSESEFIDRPDLML
jgi:hypothetical protein